MVMAPGGNLPGNSPGSLQPANLPWVPPSNINTITGPLTLSGSPTITAPTSLAVLAGAGTLYLGAASTSQFGISGNVFYPLTDAVTNLGISPSNRFGNGYFTGVIWTGTGYQGYGPVTNFGLGGANYWQIISGGHWAAAADNLYDIGASAANRPRNIYSGSSLVTSGQVYVYAGQIVVGGTGNSWFGGSGVPSAGIGVNGDYYFRVDTPATANQRIYIKSAGAWVGIV